MFDKTDEKQWFNAELLFSEENIHFILWNMFLFLFEAFFFLFFIFFSSSLTLVEDEGMEMSRES